jgi:ParB-like chromosome segregation protein Spo0J
MTEQLRVEYRKIETLIPFARNPRTHSEAQIAKLASSIVEFGCGPGHPRREHPNC